MDMYDLVLVAMVLACANPQSTEVSSVASTPTTPGPTSVSGDNANMESSTSTGTSTGTPELTVDRTSQFDRNVIVTSPTVEENTSVGTEIASGESNTIHSASGQIASPTSSPRVKSLDFIVTLGPGKSPVPQAPNSPMQSSNGGDVVLSPTAVVSGQNATEQLQDGLESELSPMIGAESLYISQSTTVVFVDPSTTVIEASVIGYAASEIDDIAPTVATAPLSTELLASVHSSVVSSLPPSSTLTLSNITFETINLAPIATRAVEYYTSVMPADSMNASSHISPTQSEMYSSMITPSVEAINFSATAVPSDYLATSLEPSEFISVTPSSSVSMTSFLDEDAIVSTFSPDVTSYIADEEIIATSIAVQSVSPDSTVYTVEPSIYVPTNAPASSVPAEEETYALKVELTLTGNCSVLDSLRSHDRLGKFQDKLVASLSNSLSFPATQIVIKSSTCGSVLVVVHFLNVTSSNNLKNSIEELKNVEELFTMFNDSYVFSLMAFKEIEEGQPTKPPPQAPEKKKSLTNVQIIVIIVCSVVGGTLIIYALGFCVYACYQKKKTKSFELGETPGSSLNMEDFTLTKLERDAPVYNEYGVISGSAPNGRSKWSGRKNGQYQSIENEMQCVAPEDIHLANTLPVRGPAPVNPDRVESPQNNGTTGQMHSHGKSGFENPSFSSDDVLDSGPDTDQELPLDAEANSDKPNHRHQDDHVDTSNERPDGVKSEGATAF